MNTQSSAMPGSSLESQVIAPSEISATRRFYWSVRRELWEYRSIYLAPLGAAVVLVGFLLSLVNVPERMRAAMALDPAHQHQAIAMPYEIAEGLIMAIALFVAVFYCLDALHGERRDRSILFWKSLPVSDLTTVLAKASIIVIIQLVAFVVIVVTQFIMLLLNSAALAASGLSVATLWSQVPLFQMSLGLLFHLVAIHALWYAPFYGWLLLVSAWAKRAPFLWATLPPLAIGLFERIAFNTSHFAHLLQYRFLGAPTGAASAGDPISMGALSPVSLQILTSAGFWTGLAACAAFLVAAVRLRRYREPI